MAVESLTRANFSKTVETEDGIALVFCSAPWCGSCRNYAPVFESVAEQFRSHSFLKMDTGAEPELASAMQVKHVPAVVLFRDGILIHRETGAVPREALEEILAKAEQLDMNLVRTQIAEEDNTSER